MLRDPGNGGPERDQVTVALLSVIPNALATVAGIVAAWNSDRTREVRSRRRAAQDRAPPSRIDAFRFPPVPFSACGTASREI